MEAYVPPTVFKLVAIRKLEPALAQSLGQLDAGIESAKYAGRRLFVAIPARGPLLVPAFERGDKINDIAAHAGIISSLSVTEVDHQQRRAVEQVLIRHLIDRGAQGGGIEVCLPCALKKIETRFRELLTFFT
jgi:hypothetical protein